MSAEAWIVTAGVCAVCIWTGLRLIIWSLSKAHSEDDQEHRKPNDA